MIDANVRNKELEMNSEKDKTTVPDDYAPLSVRDFRQMRKTIGHLWISLYSTSNSVANFNGLPCGA
jgi:hypothetical protein